jgi:putative DNA primase/helicase
MTAPLPIDTPVSRILAKLQRVKKNGAGFMARCPAHDDGTASLSLKEGKDRRVLMHCHAGCEVVAIVAALGMGMSDLYPPDTKPNGRPTASATSAPPTRPVLTKSYDYTDENGTLLFQSCRFVESTGKKTFRQRRPNPEKAGEWIYSLGEQEPVLYRLPEVLAAIHDGKRVFVVEGEKDADNLSELGYTATTNPMGAGKWREAFSTYFENADVVILPDNDEPGRSHAEQVAASLVTKRATVKVVALPNLPEKGDVSDWLDAGHDLDALETLIVKTPRWTGDAMQAAHRTRWRLDELFENDNIMRPPPAIVPRLAWAGRSTLLAAREKAGKSTLTGYITACVSNGDPFLGVSCHKGPVLIVGLEEFIGDTARRLRHFGAEPTNVHLVDRFAGDPALRPTELRDHIESVAPLLVIVDSLATWSNGMGVSDHNDASAMTGVLQPLTDMVHQLGAALIIIHHTTKGDGKARGSTAITAGVDMVCTFTIPQAEADPTLRRVESVGRLPVPRVYDIRFNGDTYTLSDSLEAPLDERIIAIVTDRPTCTANDVAAAIGSRRETTLSTIAQMLADGRLKHRGSGRGMKLVAPGHPLSELPL